MVSRAVSIGNHLFPGLIDVHQEIVIALHTISFHPAIRLPNPDRSQAPVSRYQQNGFILRLDSSMLVLDAAAFPFLNTHAPGDDVAVVADAVRMAQFRLIHKPGAQRLVLVLGL